MQPTTQPQPSAVKTRNPLINGNFALLWSGQAISYIGDFVFDTTLILWVATQLAVGQSWAPLAVSGVLLAALVPTLAIGAFAGVFVDRWDKRSTMLVMDLLRGVLILALLAVTQLVTLPLPGKLAALYLVVFLVTACQQFFGPARMAVIGDVVSSDDRARASGMGQITVALASIIGPPLAAPLFFHVGIGWSLVVNALSFVVSFGAILAVRAPTAARSVAAGEQGNARREFVEGLRFFAGNRTLMTILISGVLIMLGAGALNALDIFFVIQNLHASPSLYGWLSAAFGAGAIVGAVLAGIFANRFPPARLFWIGMVAAGIGIIAYSRLTGFVPAVVLLFAVGIPVSGVNVAVMPLMLQATPRELIGRVSAVLNPFLSLASMGSIVLASVLVSTVMSGLDLSIVGTHFGPVDTLFTITGMLSLVGGVYAYRQFHSAATAAPVEQLPKNSGPDFKTVAS